MDFSLILNNIEVDHILPFGAFLLIIIYIVIERLFHDRKKKFIPEEFDKHKAAVIFKLHRHVLYIQISKVTENNENAATYRIYPSRKMQVIMVEPGLYFIDELSYRRRQSLSSQSQSYYSEEVIDRFNQEDWLSPDKKFQVPTGAFIAEPGKVLYLGEIWVLLRQRLIFELTENFSFRISFKHNIEDFTVILPKTKKEKPTPKGFGFFIHQPYVTKHHAGSLFHAKAWFNKQYPQVLSIPLKGEYYMPGSIVDFERLPEFDKTTT